MIVRLASLAVFVALGGTVLTILLTAPPSRTGTEFVAPATIELSSGRALHLAESRVTEPDARGPYDWLEYWLKGLTKEAAEVHLGVVIFRTANANASTLPAVVALRPGVSSRPRVFDIKQGSDGSRVWLEFTRAENRFRGARISPSGACTVTKSELWRSRLSLDSPMHFLRCLFTSEVPVDRRAVWVEMKVSDHAVPVADPATLEAVWSEVLSAFSAQTKIAWRGK